MSSTAGAVLTGVASGSGSHVRLLAGALVVLGVVGGMIAGAAIGAGINPIYPLAALAVGGFVVLSLVEPQWAVVVAVAVGMGRISDVAIRFMGTPSLYKPLIAFLALLVIIQVVRLGYRSLALTRTIGVMLVFLLSQSVSAVFASEVDVALERLEDLARDFAIVFLVASLLRTTLGVRRAVWGLVALGAVLSALTVYQGATGGFTQQFFGLAQAYQQHIVGEISEPRSSGPFGDPNFFAQYLVVFATLTTFRAIDEHRWHLRLAAIGALGLNVAAIIFTYSRGGLVALCGAMLVVFWMRRPSPRVVVAGIAVLLMLMPAVPEKFVDRVGTMVDLLPGGAEGVGLEISFRGRLSELLSGIEMFIDHPIVGVGPGNSPVRYLEYASEIGLEYRSAERSTHNTFIEVAAESGILGIAAFSLALLSVTGDLRFARGRLHAQGDPAAGLAQSLLAAIIAFLLAGVFLALTYPRGLWLLMALAIALRRAAEGAEYASVPGRQDARAMPKESVEAASGSIAPLPQPTGRLP